MGSYQAVKQTIAKLREVFHQFGVGIKELDRQLAREVFKLWICIRKDIEVTGDSTGVQAIIVYLGVWICGAP